MKEDEILKALNILIQEVRKSRTDIIQELQGMRQDMAFTLALKRQKMAKKKSEDYLKFEEWAEGRRRFETHDITRRFQAVKHTALNWMGWFVEEHKEEGWIIQEAHGPYPQAAVKKM